MTILLGINWGKINFNLPIKYLARKESLWPDHSWPLTAADMAKDLKLHDRPLFEVIL